MVSTHTPGISIWNNQQGWTMPPMPTPPAGQAALVIEPGEQTISEWDAENIAQNLGYSPESRYLGENKITDPLTTDIFVFLGIFPESEITERTTVLLDHGIPPNAIKVLSHSTEVAKAS